MRRLASLLFLLSATPALAATPAHVVVFTMDEHGGLKPYSYFLRERELEPKPEPELRAILAKERKTPPAQTGHIAVRARDRWGWVVYRTVVEVTLMGESTCCPHVPFRIDHPSFVVIVPESARSISLEGWRPASTATFVFRRGKIY